MTNRWKAFWLGLFILGALVLLGWLILFIKPAVGDAKKTLTVMFSNIEKVNQGTLVTFGGRQVGKVKVIKTVTDPRTAPADAFGNLYIYVLTLQVDSCVKVYLYDEIIYASAGLLGEKSIAIIPKAPPPGAPPAYEVTGDVLYARSSDRLEQTLNKLVNVADSFQNTLEEVNIFITTNNKDMNLALKSFAEAADEVRSFMVRANETDAIAHTAQAMKNVEDFFVSVRDQRVLERLGGSLDAIHETTHLLTKGEGTFARLVNSDCLHVQLTAVLCQLRMVLYDINNYGLLFQFDRKWQRLNDMRRCCTEIPTAPYCE